MRQSHLVIAALLIASCSTAWGTQLAPLSGSNLGKVTGGDVKKQAHGVIQKRCTLCHTEDVIKQAIAAGKDMQKIQKEMEKKGAKLSANDREVLGIYWKRSPLKEK